MVLFHGDQMSSSESDEDLQELLAVPGMYRELEQKPHHINNKPALVNTLNHIKNNLPWVERLDVVTKPAPADKALDVPDVANEIDPNDDFKRENYFYRIAQAAVISALPRLRQLNVVTKRPVDYFAEMVKTDAHMGKVKKHLVEVQQRLTLAERARQMREKRKFGKQTQQAVLQARKEEKRKLTEAVKASRKKSGKDHSEELARILGEYQTDEAKINQRKTDGFHRPKDLAKRRKINHKRDYKNKKYGHGGQKKRGKRNTAESSGAGGAFNPFKHQATPKKIAKMQDQKGGAKGKKPGGKFKQQQRKSPAKAGAAGHKRKRK